VARDRGTRAKPRVNTTIEPVSSPASRLPAAASTPAPEPEAVSRSETGAATSLIPLRVFCLHRTGGHIDQAQGFLYYAARQRWSRKTWAEWNEAWEAFQKREVR